MLPIILVTETSTFGGNMDISGVSAHGAVSGALGQQQVYTREGSQVMMLKKAIDSQAQGVLALIDSIPGPSGRQGLPNNLGNTINTTA
jgi:hypothetical protein